VEYDGHQSESAVRNLFQITTLIVATTSFSLATDRATINGKVSDDLGKPLKDATVLIWHAGVKKGYSSYCPGCYRDCGKRTMTDGTGSFTLTNLDPELWFELLVVHDGYTPTFIERVDPSDARPKGASLTQRTAVHDPTRVVRGRVVDPHGRALRDAVVIPEGVTTQIEGGNHSIYGTIKGLERVAVTDSRGRFELAYNQEASGMMLQVEARGMAAKLIAVPMQAFAARNDDLNLPDEVVLPFIMNFLTDERLRKLSADGPSGGFQKRRGGAKDGARAHTLP